VGVGGHVSTEMRQETHAPGCIKLRNYMSAARILEAVCENERQKYCHQNSG